ncbi:MAG: hypothetical protein ACR5LA_10090 [Wolbachia sp.]
MNNLWSYPIFLAFSLLSNPQLGFSTLVSYSMKPKKPSISRFYYID